MTTLRVRAPAKINLHLEVLGRRADGYHELRTLLQSIDLFDEVELSPAAHGTILLEVRPAGAAPSGADNLVVRAAHALWQECGGRFGAKILLTKEIPVGAGLGGGSADAAATLRGLVALWNIEIEPTRLHQVAAGLGSDVPFFLYGGLALGVGRGDEVYPLADTPPTPVVVVMPEAEISTSEVYRRLDARPVWAWRSARVYSFVVGEEPSLDWSWVANDLEAAVVGGWPRVAEARRDLTRLGAAHVAVSGSGAAVFGLFESRVTARDAARTLRPTWRVHEGTFVRRSEAAPRVVRVTHESGKEERE